MAKKRTEPIPRPMLLNATDMAKVSGIGETTLRTWMVEGKLEYLSVGSKKLIAEEAIWEYYHRHKTEVTADMRPGVMFIRKRA